MAKKYLLEMNQEDYDVISVYNEPKLYDDYELENTITKLESMIAFLEDELERRFQS
tara:strand:- start:43 stop:210 length:168 start_codon:yes stop_codon:yes gene_type:complete